MLHRITVLSLMLTLAASCSVKVTTPGRAIVTNKTPEDVFGLLVRSINESEFTIISMDKDLGFISASRAGPLLAPKDIQINCNVQESADGVVVDVKSTFTGDIVAYGTTKGAIVAMFKSFVQYVPDAKLSIDGKPFKP